MIEHNRHKRKFYDFIYSKILKIDNPQILEFGVSERGMSTELFLDLCKKKNGKLFSVDVNYNVKKFKTNCWEFINTRDDDFSKVEGIIKNNSFDIIYLDTIHKANHVSKIFYHYYRILKKGGYFFIDDTSCLPYTKLREKNNFSQEVNNHETFDKILEIFNENHKNIDLEFSFVGTGIAQIRKLSDDELKKSKKIDYRKITMKNLMRKIILKLKNKFI